MEKVKEKKKNFYFIHFSLHFSFLSANPFTNPKFQTQTPPFLENRQNMSSITLVAEKENAGKEFKLENQKFTKLFEPQKHAVLPRSG